MGWLVVWATSGPGVAKQGVWIHDCCKNIQYMRLQSRVFEYMIVAIVYNT
jgi:hypothetical protein